MSMSPSPSAQNARRRQISSHGSRLGDDLLQPVEPGVLEVHVVDPARPVADGRDRVAPSEQQVPGVKAQPHVAELQQSLDLPLGFDVGGGVVMKGRIEATLATTLDRPGESVRKSAPAGVVETDAAVERRAPRVA